MMAITRITNIDHKKHIALIDTSSISFMQGLEAKGIQADVVFGQNKKEECRRSFYYHFG